MPCAGRTVEVGDCETETDFVGKYTTPVGLSVSAEVQSIFSDVLFSETQVYKLLIVYKLFVIYV